MVNQEMDEFVMQTIFEDLEEYPLQEVIDALRAWRKNPDCGYFKLTVADIIRQINTGREAKRRQVFYLPEEPRKMLPSDTNRPPMRSMKDVTAWARGKFGQRSKVEPGEKIKPEYHEPTAEEVADTNARREAMKRRAGLL